MKEQKGLKKIIEMVDKSLNIYYDLIPEKERIVLLLTKYMIKKNLHIIYVNSFINIYKFYT